MSESAAKILCATCLVEVTLPEKPSAETVIACPSCKHKDTLGDAARQARRHATHVAQRAFEKKLQSSGRRLSHRTTSALPERSLRWISNHVA
ncbi:MAG: hypothetical protein ACU0GG_15880 [Paracoccaceae bacterium]